MSGAFLLDQLPPLMRFVASVASLLVSTLKRAIIEE
jgi:hypothetical protein